MCGANEETVPVHIKNNSHGYEVLCPCPWDADRTAGVNWSALPPLLESLLLHQGVLLLTFSNSKLRVLSAQMGTRRI